MRISSSTVHNIIQIFREISVRKGQGRRPLLDACDLRALRRHCITHLPDSVIDITKWAQEYFQKPLSVDTIHRAICRCQLKLYHVKLKPYLNMFQKHRRVNHKPKKLSRKAAHCFETRLIGDLKIRLNDTHRGMHGTWCSLKHKKQGITFNLNHSI